MAISIFPQKSIHTSNDAVINACNNSSTDCKQLTDSYEKSSIGKKVSSDSWYYSTKLTAPEQKKLHVYISALTDDALSRTHSSRTGAPAIKSLQRTSHFEASRLLRSILHTKNSSEFVTKLEALVHEAVKDTSEHSQQIAECFLKSIKNAIAPHSSYGQKVELGEMTVSLLISREIEIEDYVLEAILDEVIDRLPLSSRAKKEINIFCNNDMRLPEYATGAPLTTETSNILGLDYQTNDPELNMPDYLKKIKHDNPRLFDELLPLRLPVMATQWYEHELFKPVSKNTAYSLFFKHAYSRHSAKSDQEIIERLEKENIPASGAYYTIKLMEQGLTKAIDDNLQRINNWMKEADIGNRLTIDHPGIGKPISSYIRKGDKKVGSAQKIKVVLSKFDSDHYYIVTSYATK